MSERVDLAAAADLDRAIDRLAGRAGYLRPVGEDELVSVARLLRDALPVFHPRIGFAESLAGRLVGAGRLASSTGGVVTPFAALETAGDDAPATVPRRRRAWVAGGALVSGITLAVPIAGAALVAWRRGRAPGAAV